MKTPRSGLRITAYHMVDASPRALDRCQGRGGGSIPSATPASTSWRRVAT